MPLASTDPSFGSIRLQPFHLYARELRAVELADALRPQPADEIVAGGRFVDQTLDVNAQAGRAVRRQQGEGVAQEVDGAPVVAAQKVVERRRDLDDPLEEVRQPAVLSPPDILQRLVAVVETPGVELANAFGQRRSLLGLAQRGQPVTLAGLWAHQPDSTTGAVGCARGSCAALAPLMVGCRTTSGRGWRARQQRLYAGSVDRLEPVGLGGCQVEPPSRGVPRNPCRSSGRQRDPSRTSGRTRRCLRGATADVRISRRYSRPGSMLAGRRYRGRDRRCGWLHGWNMRS